MLLLLLCRYHCCCCCIRPSVRPYPFLVVVCRACVRTFSVDIRTDGMDEKNAFVLEVNGNCGLSFNTAEFTSTVGEVCVRRERSVVVGARALTVLLSVPLFCFALPLVVVPRPTHVTHADPADRE